MRQRLVWLLVTTFLGIAAFDASLHRDASVTGAGDVRFAVVVAAVAAVLTLIRATRVFGTLLATAVAGGSLAVLGSVYGKQTAGDFLLVAVAAGLVAVPSAIEGHRESRARDEQLKRVDLAVAELAARPVLAPATTPRPRTGRALLLGATLGFVAAARLARRGSARRERPGR
jgi:hypothetical protein